MRFRHWIIPQEKVFFDLLQAVSLNLLASARALCEIVDSYVEVAEKRRDLKDLEHKGDDAVHEIFEALNRTFVTPFDREDIVALASNMDNVLDMIYASAVRLDMYELVSPTKPMVELADIIRAQCERIEQAVELIRDKRNGEKVESLWVEINRLENQADDVLNKAVADLFKGTDPIEIIKLKDIYEMMEKATDFGEDVADTLSDIVVKYR
jgi:hypothetical protein